MTVISRLERRLARLQKLLDSREDIAREIIDELTVTDIKNRMFAADYSIRIIDEVEVRDVRIVQNKIEYTIFNQLLVGDGSFDIARGREEGIEPHKIYGFPLAFPGTTVIGTPATIFAMSVNHPGVEATWIIRDSVRENEVAVEQRYKLRVQNRVREIKNSS